MPRTARVVVKGVQHHLVQRGNNSQSVFFTDDDRRMYLGLLRKTAEKYNLRISGYCLMTNHIHLIAIPCEEDSLAKGFGQTQLLYSNYINHLYHRSGHLWQNRFYSCPLDDEHFWKALRYVETNPVRADIVRSASEYPWSSAAIHIGIARGTGLIDVEKWRTIAKHVDWKKILSRIQNEKDVAAIRENTHGGRPFGSEQFVNELEVMFGRCLRPQPRGRPWRKN